MYKEYIDAGFIRNDTKDSADFNKTGNYGFFLVKKLNDRSEVIIYSDELNCPKLYIQKKGQETYHIINITPDAAKDLFS